VVLTPDQTCNAVTVDNAGGFGLCAGMPPTITGTVITNVYPDTTTAAAIKADLNAAFLSITPPAGPPAVGSLAGGIAIAAPTTLGNVAGSPLVLGDNWFVPGVYTSLTSILITGDVTLDGQGNPNAIFVFQSASSLTTADGAPSPGAHARILLTNGAKASNVWWQVASSATIGSYSEVQGNILAAFDITMKTGATACGRSMAGAWVGGSGAFIFDSNVVSVPGNGCPL
jgi:Ice-binding-like